MNFGQPDSKMTLNAHIRPQLDAHAQLVNPGFALLIDAPWGAGKTHSLKGWLSDRSDCLYVSVYGAKSSAAIEEVMFQALLDRRDIKLPQSLAPILEGFTEKFTGAKIDLTGAFRRSVMNFLPQVLVFDDIERTEMCLSELFSVINRFVEHEKRRVVLLANQVELRSKQAEVYDRTKEKLIGRTISLLPDVRAAVEGFLASMEKDAEVKLAVDKLKAERGLISEVFEASGSSNLRLLRCSMLEFVRAFGQIPPEMRENCEGMRYLLATFVALSIAFHGGDIGAEALKQDAGWARAIWQANGQHGDAPAATPLEVLQQRFSEHPYVRLHGQVVSAELAMAWIGRGHVTSDLLSQELGKSAVFGAEHPEAWQTLWWWVKRSEAEVDAALKVVKRQLYQREIRDPLIIMHLVGIMLELADVRIGWNSREDVEKEVLAYLGALENASLLPTDLSRRRWENVRFDTGEFGLGFYHNRSKEFCATREELLEALDRSFWRKNPKRVEELFKIAKSDPSAFVDIIDDRGRRNGLPNYAHEPIFSDADPAEAARLFFSLKPEATHDVLDTLKRRVHRLEMDANGKRWNHRSERDWLLQVRNAAYELAAEAAPIRAAQIGIAIKWHLDFLDGDDQVTERNDD